MTDDFAPMIAEARAFLAELARNNDRDWFEPRKARFKTDIEGPARLVVSLLAEDLTAITGRPHEGKLGRLHRDVRFSKDKSPYHAYVHGHWRGGHPAQGWLMRIDAGGCALMTGLHAPDPEALRRYRAAVDRDGPALDAAVAAGEAAGATLDLWPDDCLARVPRPYVADHPRAGHLRRRQIILGRRLDDRDLSDGLLPALAATATALAPFWRWCAAAMDGRD